MSFIKKLSLKILNSLGFYRISQLSVRAHCGICGRWTQQICTIESDGWTICKDCGL